MFDERRLLGHEYFPAELPPCFSTVSLAEHLDAVEKGVDAVSKKMSNSIPLTFSGYKSESSRRWLALPNPYHYYKAVKLIVEREEDIKKILKGSSYSLTAPTTGKIPDTAAYARKSASIADTKRELERLYQDNRYEIYLDINTFFDSVYTHSIPWAIHGIAEAKKNRRGSDLWGNELDACAQALNYGQTNGLLVGNAVSRIISEIILCTVDRKVRSNFSKAALRRKGKSISCCRYVDDYYIYVRESGQIQEVISYIRSCLAEYHLTLNENKVRCSESPFLYGKEWADRIRQYIHLPPEVFLSKLVEEYRTSKDIALLKYGLRIISRYRYTRRQWETMQSRLLNIWVRFPVLADRILDILLENRALLKRDPIKKAAYSVIDAALNLNHEQELTWAVWFLKTLEIKPSSEYVVKVLKSAADIPILTALDMVYAQGMESNKSIQTQLASIRKEFADEDIELNKQGNETPGRLMWSEHWLLAYESRRNHWLETEDGAVDYAEENEFFAELLQAGVSFYNSDYTYPEPAEKADRSKYEYATRAEVFKRYQELRDAIARRPSGITGAVPRTEDEKEYYDSLVDALEISESIY